MSDNDHDRLKSLSDRIDAVRAEEATEKAKDADTKTNADNMGAGARAGAELITCMLAGGLLGWAIDHFFHTTPIFLIVFFLTGIGTGFYEVYRITNNMGKSIGFKKK